METDQKEYLVLKVNWKLHWMREGQMAGGAGMTAWCLFVTFTDRTVLSRKGAQKDGSFWMCSGPSVCPLHSCNMNLKIGSSSCVQLKAETPPASFRKKTSIDLCKQWKEMKVQDYWNYQDHWWLMIVGGGEKQDLWELGGNPRTFRLTQAKSIAS